MRIYTQEAEELFLRELKKPTPHDSGVQCLIARFSQYVDKSPQWFWQAAQALEIHMKDPDAALFHFQDDDIALISSQLTQTDMGQFARMLGAPQVMLSVHPLPAARADLMAYGAVKRDAVKAQHKRDMKPFTGSVRELMAATIAQRRSARRSAGILLVEEDEVHKGPVQTTLEGLYALSIASDAEEAVASYVNSAPDVLLIGATGPGPASDEVLRRVLEIDPNAYVVLLGGIHPLATAVEHGAAGVVSLPMTPEKLLNYIWKSPYVQEKKKKADEKASNGNGTTPH